MRKKITKNQQTEKDLTALCEIIFANIDAEQATRNIYLKAIRDAAEAAIKKMKLK